MMIRMVGRWMFLLVPAHPGSPLQRAVTRLLLLLWLLVNPSCFVGTMNAWRVLSMNMFICWMLKVNLLLPIEISRVRTFSWKEMAHVVLPTLDWLFATSGNVLSCCRFWYKQFRVLLSVLANLSVLFSQWKNSGLINSVYHYWFFNRNWCVTLYSEKCTTVLINIFQNR